LKLLYQTHSPFARKVLVFAYEKGIADRIHVLHHETSPTAANAEVFAQNPLGKVPVLLRDGESALFDSDVICAFLDTLAAGSLYPGDDEDRWDALRMQALAQDLAQSGIALRWETVRRPEALRYPPLAQGYALKLTNSYDWLEANADFDAPIHIGHIALATALDWLAFRDLPSFRDGRARLTGWFDSFLTRPSMKATPLSGDTQDGAGHPPAGAAM
jgi:glutathione S-transferase